MSTAAEADANQPSSFNNGLTTEQNDALDDLIIEAARIVFKIEDLGRHRSYSLAITNLEQAMHWLRDRKHKPA